MQDYQLLSEFFSASIVVNVFAVFTALFVYDLAQSLVRKCDEYLSDVTARKYYKSLFERSESGLIDVKRDSYINEKLSIIEKNIRNILSIYQVHKLSPEKDAFVADLTAVRHELVKARKRFDIS